MLAINEGEFKALIKDGNAAVLFGGDHCSACKAVEPLVGSTCAMYKLPAYKLDASDSPIAMRYAIRSLPTLILFRNGIETHRLIGSFTHQELLNALIAR